MDLVSLLQSTAQNQDRWQVFVRVISSASTITTTWSHETSDDDDYIQRVHSYGQKKCNQGCFSFICLFNGISNFVGYLMPMLSLYKDSSGAI